ncbi:MAG TPA: sigma-54 factor interaction domain-containing protein [Candidatus Binataceae bacterium]
MVGQSLAIRRAIRLIEEAAPTSAPVIITGESGTGKELAARAIHDRSPRQNRPYVAINCAAVPESLIESELFGHERGAFTGADRRREGCFERANGGSLLLDEITEMRPEMQAKLLRVLEEKRILRLGASKELPIDVRVFAASNRSLHQSIRQGRLREDVKAGEKVHQWPERKCISWRGRGNRGWAFGRGSARGITPGITPSLLQRITNVVEQRAEQSYPGSRGG